MNALLPLAKQAIISSVLNNEAPFMRKNRFGLGLAALSGLLFVMALIFVTISAYGWLLTVYAQPVAALIVSTSVLVLSLVCGLGGFVLLKQKPKSSLHDGDVSQLVTDVADMIGEELFEPIQENPKTAMLLASLAGFVAGDHLH